MVTGMFTGADLRRYRLLLGMKQAEFAARMGITQPTLSLIEGGTTPVSQKHLDRLASRFSGKDLKTPFRQFLADIERQAGENLSALTVPTEAHCTLLVWAWEEGFDLHRRRPAAQAADLVIVRGLRDAAIAVQVDKRTKWWEAGEIFVFERCRREDISDGVLCLVQVKVASGRPPKTSIAVARLAPAKRGRVLQFEPISPGGPVFAADESALALLRAVFRGRYLR
jgi:transcriptional regulator with XRE-family HTH domain